MAPTLGLLESKVGRPSALVARLRLTHLLWLPVTGRAEPQHRAGGVRATASPQRPPPGCPGLWGRPFLHLWAGSCYSGNCRRPPPAQSAFLSTPRPGLGPSCAGEDVASRWPPPLDPGSRPHPGCDNHNCLGHCHMSPGGRSGPPASQAGVRLAQGARPPFVPIMLCQRGCPLPPLPHAGMAGARRVPTGGRMGETAVPGGRARVGIVASFL